MGWENVFQVEIDSFCQKVLEKNFPNVKRYGDIKEFNGTKYRGAIDVLSGGFPCQPFSMAGKRKGNKDDRYLWPEMLRVIRQIQPAFIVGENVYGLVNWSQGLVFEQVCSDLENEGFQVQPVILPACAVDAPHRRDRVWFVAHSEENGNSRGLPAIQSKDGCIRKPKEHWENHMQSSDNGTQRDVANTFKKRPTGGGNNGKETTTSTEIKTRFESVREFLNPWENFPTQSPLCDRNDGLPTWLVRSGTEAGGNAIVPKVAFEIFKAIDNTITPTQ